MLKEKGEMTIKERDTMTESFVFLLKKYSALLDIYINLLMD